MKNIAIVLFIGIVFLSCNQNENKNNEPLDEDQIIKDSLTFELDSIEKSGDINGFAVAIVDENGVLYENGFGLSNMETKEKYTENTIQHIASVSKTLIGISLMKAKEMGKLNLDDPIQDYLPFKGINPNYPDGIITIRHLATHTFGISDTDEQYMDRAWIITENQDLTNVSTDYHVQRLNPNELNIPMEEYLKGYVEIDGVYYQKDNYIKFKPGERFHYSNVGATLCALVIEKATGQAFDSFTKEHILQPLGMNSTAWSLEDVDITKHSRLYRHDNSVLPFYTSITYPDGMLISSSSDIAKYLTELIKGFTKGTLLNKAIKNSTENN
jgi:CubicO group peptidase (beta-lactamase class C family)